MSSVRSVIRLPNRATSSTNGRPSRLRPTYHRPVDAEALRQTEHRQDRRVPDAARDEAEPARR
jgi:hypothetical protein